MEKRRWKRILTSLCGTSFVEVESGEEGVRQEFELYDISPGGCRLRSGVRAGLLVGKLLVGDRVRVQKIVTPSGEIQELQDFEGEVRWRRENQYGVMFYSRIDEERFYRLFRRVDE